MKINLEWHSKPYVKLKKKGGKFDGNILFTYDNKLTPLTQNLGFTQIFASRDHVFHNFTSKFENKLLKIFMVSFKMVQSVFGFNFTFTDLN